MPSISFYRLYMLVWFCCICSVSVYSVVTDEYSISKTEHNTCNICLQLNYVLTFKHEIHSKINSSLRYKLYTATSSCQAGTVYLSGLETVASNADCPPTLNQDTSRCCLALVSAHKSHKCRRLHLPVQPWHTNDISKAQLLL